MNSNARRSNGARLVVWLCLAAVAGCGDPNIGRVTGTVRMDGKPLPNAMVTFKPLSGQRPGTGLTNEQGEYELIYTRDAKGAIVGEHEVEITTANELMGDDATEVIAETVPARYNAWTELRVKVSRGRNVLNFDLTSDGEIVQPEY